MHNSSLVFRNGHRSWLDYWILLWLVAGIIGLVYSRFVLSMSIMGLSAIALLPQSWSPVELRPWSALLGDRRVWLGTIIIFSGVVLSGINSSDVSSWTHHLRIRLPMLTVPLGVALLPPLRREVAVAMVYLFTATLAISSIPLLIHLALHYEEVIDLIGQGVPMDTPVNHIRYSLMIAFAIVASGILYLQNRANRKATIFLGLAGWLFVFLHVLAVRSGIAVLYCTIVALVIVLVLRKKAYKQGLLALVTLAVVGWLAISYVPTIQRKISYMHYDLSSGGRNYSDSERIASLRVGLALASDNPIVGTGIGDLKVSTEATYQDLDLNVGRYHLVHNQWLFIVAGMGYFGLVVFMIGYIWPLLHGYHDYLTVSLLVILAVSFMVEHTLETAVGTGMYMLLLCLCLWGREVVPDVPPAG